MPFSRPKYPPPPALIRWMVGILALLNVLAMAASTWLLVQNRRHYRERAEIQTHNLAEVIEGNVISTLERGDLAILTVRDEMEHDPNGPRIQTVLQSQQKRAGVLGGLRVTDTEGHVLRGTPLPPSLAGAAGEDILHRVRAGSRASLVLSPPFRAPGKEGWCVLLARRWEHPDGTFAGEVLGDVPLEQFRQAIARIHVGPAGTVSLRAPDLSLLARHPARYGPDLAIGSRAFTGPYLQAVQSGQPSVQFTARSLLDGEIRTYTLRRLDRFDLFLLVGLGQRDYLQPWKHQVLFAVFASLVMAALSLALGWQSRADWIRHLEVQQQMRAEEEKYRLLAENASAVIWTLDPGGRLTFISPSIQRQRGWTPEEFMALPVSMRAISGDGELRIRDRIAQARQLPPGSQPFEHDLLEAVVACRDGREIQVEAQWRVVWGRDGRLLGFQGVTRDITERKRLEAEREATIAELKALKERLEHVAQHDHLTGLPNRFLFRDRLEQALIQARRRQSCFVLLFLDLDRFKAVNDTHGHDVGDALLVAAAARLKACLRAADTLARLGGDEFTALLLDVQGRDSILRVVQSMVEALDRPFDLGQVSCSIGVSIGIAVYPEDGGSAEVLQTAADGAMYAVKQSGRHGYRFAGSPDPGAEPVS